MEIEKKIYIENNENYKYKHRSGWPFAMSFLQKLHNKNGVLFNSFLEKKFAWGNNIKKPQPYKESWIGIFHVPDNVPEWFNDKQTPREIFKNKYFIKSLKYCKGFYCLSEYEKAIIQRYTSLPVNVIFHPTETPKVKFSFENFINNKEKEIVQMGTFLRKLSSIFLLHTKTFKKSSLGMNKYSLYEMEKEIQLLNRKIDINSVKIYKFLNSEDYDKLLSQNIAFLDLFDASANNTVIECIVRNTPLLVVHHPAVVEYLGEDYPFYFKTMEEAAGKIENVDLIKKTYEYLKNLKTKDRLTGEAFVKSMVESQIYKSLKIEKVNGYILLKRLYLRKISSFSILISKIKNKIKNIILFVSPSLYFKIKKRMINKNF